MSAPEEPAETASEPTANHDVLLIVDFDTFTSSPSELLTLVRSGGVFYGGLIAAVAVALWYLRGEAEEREALAGRLILEFTIGGIAGLLGGFAMVWIINKLDLAQALLEPVGVEVAIERAAAIRWKSAPRAAPLPSQRTRKARHPAPHGLARANPGHGDDQRAPRRS